MKQKLFKLAIPLIILFLISAQCAPASTPATPTPAQTPTPAGPVPISLPPVEGYDLWQAILERGYIKVAVKVWPDSLYGPPLYRNEFGALDGYEVDLAWALADALGVGLEMSESDPRRIASGDWNGEWDVALAWLPATDNAAQTLIFSEPYAYDSGALLSAKDNAQISDVLSLSGKRVGTPEGSIYEQILSGQAPSVQGTYIPGPVPADIQLVPFKREDIAFTGLISQTPTFDAVIHSQFIATSALESGLPLQQTQAGLYPVPVSLAFARNGLPSERLRGAINDILSGMKQDGTLAELSLKRYGQDVTSGP